MKKKIKNLNQKEIDKVCLAHSCIDCPLCLLVDSDSVDSSYDCLANNVLHQKEIKKIMETEIEIEVPEHD